nr:hypothetical protein [uncultured Oribacterium sp.]
MKTAFVSSEELKVENDIFDSFRGDMNLIIRELIKNMIDKDSEDGKITATIDVQLFPTFGDGGTAYQPILKHKVCSTLQLKDEMKGLNTCKDMELVLDEETNTYHLRHATGKPQMSIYDMDLGDDGSEEEYDN